MSKGTEFVEDYMKKLHTDKSPSTEIHGPSKGAKFIEEYMRRLNAKKAEITPQEEKSSEKTEIPPQTEETPAKMEVVTKEEIPAKTEKSPESPKIVLKEEKKSVEGGISPISHPNAEAIEPSRLRNFSARTNSEIITQNKNLSTTKVATKTEKQSPTSEIIPQTKKSDAVTKISPPTEKLPEKTEISPSTESLSPIEEIVHQNDDEKHHEGVEIPEYLKEMLGVEHEQEKYEESENFHTLKVSSLYKSFGRKNVIKGIDIQMHTGEILGLLGPNGAGKTTTFYMIVGFIKPTKGEVFMDGTKITHLPMYKRAKLGISYLPQEPSVFKKLTVEENIWAILETRKDLTYHQKKQALENLIEEFSIGRIRKQPAFTLSGGERRRTEIARSLAIEPKFLLLDEPFAGIDPIAIADIKKVINQLAKRDIGLLITDHNVRDTLEITSRAIIINNGVIMMQGTRQAILDSPSAREVYLGKDFSM